MAGEDLYSSSSGPLSTAPALSDQQPHESGDLMDRYWQHRLTESIKIYGPPVIFCGGATFNLLCLCVLLRPSMRTKSTFAYLTGLAIFDIAYLCANPLQQWVTYLTGVDTVSEETWLCICMNFFAGLTSHFSVWVLVLVTAERLFVIVNPLKGPLVCKRSRAYAAMGCLFFLVVALNLHAIWTFDIVSYNRESINATSNLTIVETVPYCGPPDGYQTFHTYWNWIDTCVYSLLPSVVMLSMNVVIIFKTHEAQRMRRALSVGNLNSAARDEHRRLTIMLLTLSFTFILTTTPMSVFTVYISAAGLLEKGLTHEEDAKLTLGQELCRQIMWMNHAINFFLYCLTGRKFRQEFLQMFGCGRASRKRTQQQTNTRMSTVSASVVGRERRSIDTEPKENYAKQAVRTLNESQANPLNTEGILNGSDVVLIAYKEKSGVESRA